MTVFVFSFQGEENNETNNGNININQYLSLCTDSCTKCFMRDLILSF